MAAAAATWCNQERGREKITHQPPGGSPDLGGRGQRLEFNDILIYFLCCMLLLLFTPETVANPRHILNPSSYEQIFSAPGGFAAGPNAAHHHLCQEGGRHCLEKP